MNTKEIMQFLKGITAHNDREWFQSHKDMYQQCKADFEAGIDQAIIRLSGVDSKLSHLKAKDCCYRFYRDVRFSPDKSPYKRHLGAYICEHGKKSLMGGYYIHLQPGHSMIAFGAYWLPTNILTACRNEILGNYEEWLRCVNNASFKSMYGEVNTSTVDIMQEAPEKGFCFDFLKRNPKDFEDAGEKNKYLRMKNYCCWRMLPDDFFMGDGWLEQLEQMAVVARPMIAYINNVISDYE
jgi:uncharacterized protein (TIGR02453 family)